MIYRIPDLSNEIPAASVAGPRLGLTIRSLALRNTTYLLHDAAGSSRVFKIRSDDDAPGTRRVEIETTRAIDAPTLRSAWQRSFESSEQVAGILGHQVAALHRDGSPTASTRRGEPRVLPVNDVWRGKGEHKVLPYENSENKNGWGDTVEPPWVCRIGQLPVSALSASSSASLDLLALVQQSRGFTRAADQIRASWNVSAKIHNDLKWDNILAGLDDRGQMSVTIIDWEMAGVGDPCWDVGTVLGEFITFWSQSIPVVGGEPYEDHAKYPIEELQPAIRAFWRSYAKAMAFDAGTARERLLKSVRFAGARLIQTAYERAQTMTSLTPHSYLLLQLSLNVMEQPEDAAAHLLGIQVNDFWPS